MWNRFSIAYAHNQRWMSVWETGTHSFKGDMSKSLDPPPQEKRKKKYKNNNNSKNKKQKLQSYYYQSTVNP